jgi:signal transduction histidine kinase
VEKRVFHLIGLRRLVPRGFHASLPLDQQERAERAIAVARALIAASALAGMALAPASPGRYAQISYWVLSGYVAFAFSAAALLSFGPQRWTLPALAVHAVDLSVAAAVTLFSSDTNNPFWVLFLFTLLAAAYRWGFAETVATACAAVAFLVVEAVVTGSMLREGGPIVQGQLEIDRLIMRSASLLLAGVLTGYLAETEKQFRSEITAIADIISRADVRAGLKQTMAAVFDALLRLFEANRVLLIVHETRTDQLFMWEAGRRVEGSVQEVRSMRLESDSLPTFIFAPEAAAWHAVRRGGRDGERFDVVALDRGGSRLGNPERWTLPSEFVNAVRPFDELMAVGIELGNEWTGRLFLVDPLVGADRTGMLGFGLRIVRQIAPAVQNVYLIRRVRSAAAATERGHIARELHDGVIQSVTGVEIQVAALSLRLAKESPGVANELRRLKMILREEVVSLRELMHQMKPLELGPHQLVDALEDSVQRFQRETGISARFVTQLDRVALTPRACREIAQILHEALVNVRRHSGARNVFVRLTAVNGDCRLSIDDDGCGFPFAGRFSQADLEATRKGPLVIKERVRLLGGELTIESDPGRGARLEIAVPISTHGIHR